MIFRKRIPRSCSYCLNGAKVDNGTILCAKKGLVPADKACRKFVYDPCKRIPPKQKALDFNSYTDQDFSL